MRLPVQREITVESLRHVTRLFGVQRHVGVWTPASKPEITPPI